MMFERLTRWENNDKDVADLIERKSDFDGLTEAINRLAAYEDSGLSPDEVLELKEKYETEKINSEATYNIMCGLTEEVERLKKCLAEYEQTKADGRLIELPCKIGDTVYVIYGKSKILETKVDLRFWNDDDGNGAMTMFIRTPYGLFEFDKTAFLSREEAEKALEVRE